MLSSHSMMEKSRKTDTSRGSSTSGSRTWSSPTSTRKGGSSYTEKTNGSDNDHSMKNCDQILSGKVGNGKPTGRRHLLLQIGGNQEHGMNHNKKNGKVSNGVKIGKYSLSEPSTFLQESRSFVVFFDISRTDVSECRARGE